MEARRWRVGLAGFMMLMALITWHYWDALGSEEVIRNLVAWHRSSPAVEVLSRSATFLGDHEFYMIFLAIILWSVDRSLGLWSAVVLLLSGTYTNVLKDLWQLPRPDIEGITLPGGYAFPSGHTLTSVTLWGYLAARLSSQTIRLWMILAVAAVGASRVILGYHYPRDVTGGVALGLAFLLAFLLVESRLAERTGVGELPFSLLLVGVVVLPLILFVVYRGGDAPLLMGFLMGAGSGYLLEHRLVRSRVGGNWRQRVLRPVVGLPVMFALVLGLGGIAAAGPAFLHLLFYAVVGLWVTLGAPVAFISLGLADRHTGDDG